MDTNACIYSFKCWENIEELQLFLKARKCSLYLLENFNLFDLCKLYYGLDMLICINH